LTWSRRQQCSGRQGVRREAESEGLAEKCRAVVDGESLEAFAEQRNERLGRMHEELRTDTYAPQPVKRTPIPKEGKPGEYRLLGIPTIYDRVCQQAVLNRLEPIFEPVFDEANFGYRRGRSAQDALRKTCDPCLIRSTCSWCAMASLRSVVPMHEWAGQPGAPSQNCRQPPGLPLAHGALT